MNRRRTICWMVGITAVIGAGFFWAQNNHRRAAPLAPGLAASVATKNPRALSLASASASTPSSVVAENIATKADPASAAFTALVETRLRSWEDDDDPNRRDERVHELEQLLDRLGPDISARLKIIEALPASLANFAFGLPSFQRWMFGHPQAALDWMSAHPEISSTRVLTLFQDWGQKDRASLRVYLENLPAGDWRENALAAASYEALSDDPAEAVRRARQLQPGGPQTGLLEIATAAWSRRDAAAAAHWVGQMDNTRLRQSLIGSLAIGYADTEPDSAATWAVSLLPPGKDLDRSAAEIAGAWARQDPVAAAAWVARFPAGEARQRALGNVLNAWSARDRPAAVAWVRGLPDDALRAQATVFLDEPVSL